MLDHATLSSWTDYSRFSKIVYLFQELNIDVEDVENLLVSCILDK